MITATERIRTAKWNRQRKVKIPGYVRGNSREIYRYKSTGMIKMAMHLMVSMAYPLRAELAREDSQRIQTAKPRKQKPIAEI